MNHHDSTRVLRIEPLENRSLLAGDFFVGDDFRPNLFGDDGRGDHRQRNVQRDRPQQIRSANQSNQQPTRIAVDEVARPAASDLLPPPLRVVIVEAPRLPNPSPANAEQSGLSSPPIPAIDAALAVLATNDVTETITDAIEGGHPRSEVLTEFRAAPAAASVPLDELRTRRSDIQPTPIEHDRGLIDLSPLEFDFAKDASRDNDPPWQLGNDILPRIRSAIQRTSDVHEQVVDAAILSWFGGNMGTGGMIALNQLNLPHASYDTAIEWLDVALESDLKLHRSLGMIATGVTPPLSDVALDAIMASLAEITQSQVQPVKAIHRFEVPKIACPAIAILTAAAIAARRKHNKGQEPGDAQATPLLG